MAVQNLVSATLAPEVKTDILVQLADIKTKLGFLLSLQSSEIKGLFKAGNALSPFLDKAYGVANAHPDILPKVFDVVEFKKDYQLSKDLRSIGDQVNQLAESLDNTITAVNSDALGAALEIYSAVKQHSDKVPGLHVASAEMGEFFKRPKGAGKKA